MDGCFGKDDSLPCTERPGWKCDILIEVYDPVHEMIVPKSICEPINCDGIVVGDEECDDGNTIDNDGCTN